MCACALFGAAFSGSAGAGSANTYCNMWHAGQNCTTPWNYWSVHTIHNGGGPGSASVFCYAHHGDGSWTGGTQTVHPGETKIVGPTNGYNQGVCQMNDDGGGGFPIAIYSGT